MIYGDISGRDHDVAVILLWIGTSSKTIEQLEIFCVISSEYL